MPISSISGIDEEVALYSMSGLEVEGVLSALSVLKGGGVSIYV